MFLISILTDPATISFTLSLRVVMDISKAFQFFDFAYIVILAFYCDGIISEQVFQLALAEVVLVK